MILHPIFLKTRKKVRLLVGDHGTRDIEKIEGWYGSDPSPDDLLYLRNTLLDSLTRKLKEENAEAWFIPRFLGATGVFVAVFFVLTYAIRDPIPFIDEFLIALVSAILVFWSWSRSGLESLQFKFQLTEFTQIINQAMFYPSEEVRRMEVILEQAESMAPQDLFASLEEQATKSVQVSNPFTTLLDQECDQLKKTWARICARHRSSSQARKAAVVDDLIAEGKDLHLLYLYFRVRSADAGFLPSNAGVP